MSDMQTALVATDPAAMQRIPSQNEQDFALAQRQATALSKSSLVPTQFQNNVPNCLIAMNMAKRLGADPLMVMQNLYIVHGKPSWSSTFLIATLNQTKRFTPLQYRFDGTGDEYGCTAFARDMAGNLIEGPKVTWAMVRAEGWNTKNGSKWKTMPELMFRYRAASFFVKTTCPEIAMGLQTSDEIHDVIDVAAQTAPALAALRDEIEEPRQITEQAESITMDPPRKATLSEIRKLEPVLKTDFWKSFLPEAGIDAIASEEQARIILHEMKEAAIE